MISSTGVPVARALPNQALKRSSLILNAWARLTDLQRKVRRRTINGRSFIASRLYKYRPVTSLPADLA